MAVALAIVTIANYPDGIDNTERSIIVRGTVAIQPNPATYAAGGLAMVSSLNNALSAWAQEPIKAVGKSGAAPLPRVIDFWDQTASGATGYTLNWNPSTNKLQILQGGAVVSLPNAEIAVAAIPAAVSGATIYFEAQFARTTG